MKPYRLKRNWEDGALAGALLMTLVVGVLIHTEPGTTDKTPRFDRSRVTTGEPAKTSGRLLAASPVGTYEVIGDRNLLAGSGVVAPDETAGDAEEGSPEVPAVSITTMDSARRDPASDMIAPVGVVEVAGEIFVMLEDGRRGETVYRGVGQTAFGYLVRAIDGNQVKLEREGREYRLELGDNKPERTRGAIVRNPETLAQLPVELQQSVLGLLPPGSELRRVRSGLENGQMVYRVSAIKDGLDTDLRVAPDGQVLRKDSEVTFNDVPSAVVDSASRALPGYSVNPRNPPTIRDRGGQRSYEIEVRAQDGRQVDLILAPDGSVIGRD